MNCTECGTKCVKVSATECECPSCCNSFVKQGRRWVAADDAKPVTATKADQWNDWIGAPSK